MKRILLPVLSILAFGSLNAQVAKTPMIEHFTQASCGPCASQNPVLKSTLDNFGTGNYVRISHQTSFPGNDPMNESYPEGPSDRRAYYESTSVPSTSLNGGTIGQPNTVVTTSTLNTASLQTTPYSLTINHTWNSPSSLTVDVEITNTSSATVSDANRFRLAMVEDEVVYTSAPGTNGEKEFEYVLRQFYDANTGNSSTAGATLGSIDAGETVNYTFTITEIPNGVKDINEVSFAGFLQNNTSKVVYQAGKSSAVDVPGALNVTCESSTNASNDYCDSEFTPSLRFRNSDPTTITSITAEYSINDGAPVSKTFDLTVNSGQTKYLNFDVANFNIGSNVLKYSITDINSGSGPQSPEGTGMPAEEYLKLNPNGTAAPLNEGMETGTLISGFALTRDITTGVFEDPFNVGVDFFSILDGSVTSSLGATGAYGTSNRSVMFWCTDLRNNEKMSLVMQQVNLSTNSQLTFDHAYKQYSSSYSENLEIEVSTDCGASWTEVYNKSGAQLSSTGEFEQDAFYPTANDWASNVVDLSDYNNTDDVSLKFTVTSAWGNNVYIDNINIGSGTVGINEAYENTAKLSVYPNPVKNNMNVTFEVNSNQAELLVRNLQGQVVKSLSQNTVKGLNNVIVNTTDLASGVYFISIVSEDAVSTQRFVVNK
jgi:hypothetical protein